MNDLFAALELVIMSWSKDEHFTSEDLIQGVEQAIDNFDEDDMLMDMLIRKYKSIQAEHPEYGVSELDEKVMDDIKAKLYCID